MSEEKLIKARIYGEDTDFLAEVRAHHDLPSRSGNTRLGVQDRDITIHVFMTAVDGIGTREVQGILDIEVKTRGGYPDDSQRDTLWKRDWFRGQKTKCRQTVRYFGAFVLRLSGTMTQNSQDIEWGYFKDDSLLHYARITPTVLWQFMRLERHPRTLQKHSFRRHHFTQEIAIQRMAPLGFPEFERIIKRS